MLEDVSQPLRILFFFLSPVSMTPQNSTPQLVTKIAISHEKAGKELLNPLSKTLKLA